MNNTEKRILRRFYQVVLQGHYSVEQELRILKLFCKSEGTDSCVLEQLVEEIRQIDILDIDCYLLVISEDLPFHEGLRVLREVLREVPPKPYDAFQWRQSLLLEKDNNLKEAALLAYAEGRLSLAVSLWERQKYDLEAMILLSVAYAETGKHEEAMYHIALAQCWARKSLLISEPSAIDCLVEEFSCAVGRQAWEIYSDAEKDARRRMDMITNCHIGFV